MQGTAKTGNDPGSAEFIGPPTIHSHAFHFSHADELDADVVAAVSLVGQGDEPFCSRVQVTTVGDGVGHIKRGHGAVESVRAKQQHVATQNLVIAGFDADKQVASQRPAEYVASGRFGRLAR